MKLTSLLTQYLYANNRLDLPGIGTFLLDPAAMELLEGSKQRTQVPEGISFENNPSIKESPDLIAYISAQSGKMKALAMSDLDSHLELAQQFLNIGKPFTFDGIGTLVKVKVGEFRFTPIAFTTERTRSHSKETGRLSAKEDSFLSPPKAKRTLQLPVVALLVICGLGLAIWGGYAISKKATARAGETNETVLVKDSTQLPPADSVKAQQAAQLSSPNYKYVLEVSKSKRAFKRYKQLKTNLWDVKLETADSIQYKLFLLLPAIASDSTRILDSLTAMTGRKVYIEHQN